MSPIDEELYLLLQNSETRRKAFETLVTQYSEKLYWQIRRIVLVHDDTNDVLQNTFLKAWIHLDAFRGESKLSTWLYQIATNEAITFFNKQKNSTSSTNCEGLDLADQLESDSYFSGDQAELLLQKAILTLPEKQRLVFNMKYFQELKYEEISSILNTSVGALKASYHHAVKKIEAFLEKED